MIDLPFVGCHDKLPCLLVRNPARPAVVVEGVLSRHAEPPLEGARAVVDACVDH